MPLALVHWKQKAALAGHVFLGLLPQDNQPIKLNGSIHVLTSLLYFVDSYAANARIGALVVNAKVRDIVCLTLEERGHPQLEHQFIVMSMVTGIANGTDKYQC